VIAGADPRDPTSARVEVADYEAALDGDIRGVRVGVPTSYFLEDCDGPVLAAFEAAMHSLAARGAIVVPVDLPLMDAIQAYVAVMSRAEAGTIHAQWMRERSGDFAVHINSRLFASLAVPAAYYLEALGRRGPILKAFAQAVFTKVDVIASPSIRVCLPTLAETNMDSGDPACLDRAMGISANTRPFNYLGLPAASIPCGFDPAGLPISLQIAGRPFAEAAVLKVADAYQRDTDWHLRHPAFIKA
jgi:aspartyl-tRNA(Asn)/glutamyl-tRNA(Gln) amidotransferase subunit A